MPDFTTITTDISGALQQIGTVGLAILGVYVGIFIYRRMRGMTGK